MFSFRPSVLLAILLAGSLFFSRDALAQTEDAASPEDSPPIVSPSILKPIMKNVTESESDRKKTNEDDSSDTGPAPVEVGGKRFHKARPALDAIRSRLSGGKRDALQKNQAPAPPPPGKSSGVRGRDQQIPGETGAAAGAPATTFGPPQMGNVEGKTHEYKEFEPGVKYRIDYYEEDLLEFVKAMSEKFKVNFILSDKIKAGKITIISPNPVTREEAWQAFLSALHSKDYTLVRVGKFFKIIPARDAKSSPLRTYLDGGSTDPSEEVITYLLKLKHITVRDIESILKDLKSKSGEIITFEPTNTLIITDTAINIRRMVKIINELDLPGGRDSIHVIDIYYASADDIAEKLQQIFGEKGGRGASSAKATRSKSKRRKGKTQETAEEAGSVTISNVIADERTNQLIIVAPRDAMPKIIDMINRLDVPIPGDGQVHVYYLENANAEELASTLTGMAGRGASSKKGKRGAQTSPGATGELFEGEVKITADKATNSLVIVASTSDYNQLKKVIKQLDIRRRQVFVEAVIMEVTLSKGKTFGMAMNAGYTMEVDGEQVPLYGGTTLGTMSSVVVDPTTLSGLAVGLRGPELEGTEGILGDGVTLPSFGVLLQMIQTDSAANVLSTPHILTMDNEEAEIIVGSNVPFITGQARDSQNRPVLSIQRQDVALTMKIKPQINESDYVRLQIQQEITELVSVSETLGPTTTKRAAKSTVVVKDNQTIVIGGLLRDVQKSDAEKVPFLGDIPILGRLFRRDKEGKEKTNLLIFLTPHIIKDEEDFKRIFKRKMDERNEFLRKFYGTEDDYEFEVDYTQKTGLLETIRSTYEGEKTQWELKQKEEKELMIVPEEDHRAHEIGLTESARSSDGSDEVDDDQSTRPDDRPPGGRPTGEELMKRLMKTRSGYDSDED